MANVFTTFASLQNDAQTNSAVSPNLKQAGGDMHHLDVIKTAYTGATADPLYLCMLPKGARLCTDLCSVDYGDPGDALTGTVGYFTTAPTPVVIDVNYFGTVTLGGSAGHINFSAGLGDALITPITFDQNVWIVVTWGTATAAASHSECWHIVYTLG